jgi:hypothetical protein
MRSRARWAVLGVLVGGLLLLVVGGAGASHARHHEGAGPLQELVSECMSSVGPEGFGLGVVDRPMAIAGEEGEISVPCHIEIRRGGLLSFRSSSLRTRHLFISEAVDGGPASVEVVSSTITGLGESGFQLVLLDPEAVFTVRQSTLDFPLSIWASVGAPGSLGDANGGGRIEVAASVLRARGASTQGISIVAGEHRGMVDLSDVTLDAPASATKLLAAQSCRAVGMRGVPDGCTYSRGRAGTNSH